MKWVGENFCSTVKAWNTLCDAIEERINVYGVETTMKIPRHETTLSKRKFDFDAMRTLIRLLLQISYLPSYFDTWVDFDYSNEAAYDKFAIDSELLKGIGVDTYALYRVAPENVPCMRHTVSQFIFNAAKIVNDLCIYPAPIRFMIEADLYLETFDPPYSESGKASIDGYLIRAVEGKASIVSTAETLVSFQSDIYELKKTGRSRSTNHRWIYLPQTRSFNRDGWNYMIPALTGTGGLRSLDAYVSYTDPELGKHEELKKKIDMDFTIDFAENKATEEIDFSPVKSIVDRYWNLADDEIEKSVYRADMRGVHTEIYLSESNFPDLKSQYQYITR